MLHELELVPNGASYKCGRFLEGPGDVLHRLLTS